MEAPVDSLFRSVQSALTMLGAVLVAAAAPVAALAVLALAAPGPDRAPQLAEASAAQD